MRRLVFVLAALTASATQAQEAAAPPLVTGADEVIVRGRAGPKLRIELERVENAVYERFNALNSRDELDIVCMNDAPLGSHMPVRECLPKFALTAERRAAQDILHRMQGGHFAGSTQIHFMDMEEKGQELAAEMQRLAREDEQLLRELTRLAELKQTLGDRVGKRR